MCGPILGQISLIGQVITLSGLSGKCYDPLGLTVQVYSCKHILCRTFEGLHSTWNLVGRFLANFVVGPITLAQVSTRVSLGTKISRWALYCAPCITLV